ncbi:MAG TPA: hypothetical protein VFY89_06750 [Ktedonobacterales bacterium]
MAHAPGRGVGGGPKRGTCAGSWGGACWVNEVGPRLAGGAAGMVGLSKLIETSAGPMNKGFVDQGPDVLGWLES